MHIQLSNEYRLIGNHLYQRQGDTFIHCAIVPSRASLTLIHAIAWYNAQQEQGE